MRSNTERLSQQHFRLTSCWPCRSRWSSCRGPRWPPAVRWPGRRPERSPALCGRCRKRGPLAGCWRPTGPWCHCPTRCPGASAWGLTASGRGWAEVRNNKMSTQLGWMVVVWSKWQDSQLQLSAIGRLYFFLIRPYQSIGELSNSGHIWPVTPKQSYF